MLYAVKVSAEELSNQEAIELLQGLYRGMNNYGRVHAGSRCMEQIYDLEKDTASVFLTDRDASEYPMISKTLVFRPEDIAYESDKLFTANIQIPQEGISEDLIRSYAQYSPETDLLGIGDLLHKIADGVTVYYESDHSWFDADHRDVAPEFSELKIYGFEFKLSLITEWVAGLLDKSIGDIIRSCSNVVSAAEI